MLPDGFIEQRDTGIGELALLGERERMETVLAIKSALGSFVIRLLVLQLCSAVEFVVVADQQGPVVEKDEERTDAVNTRPWQELARRIQTDCQRASPCYICA